MLRKAPIIPSFDLIGVVAWARNGAIGVRFEDVAPEDHDRLQKLVTLLSQEK